MAKGVAEEGNWRKPEKNRRRREKDNMMVMTVVGFKMRMGLDGMARSSLSFSLSLPLQREGMKLAFFLPELKNCPEECF